MRGLRVAIACAYVACAEGWQIRHQRVEYLRSPALGIDVPRPRFGWVVEDDAGNARGVTQASFQIVVRDADAGTVVWDSGKVDSAESRHVVMGSVGKNNTQLKSASAYDWTVRVWLIDAKGKSAFNGVSDKARFVTGLMDPPNDWKGAQWLTARKRARNFCKSSFNLPQKPPKRAILVLSGLGYFKATLNGAPVSDAELEPGWTDYSKRIPYSTYDVTPLLKSGANDFGISLGNGWFASNNGSDPTPDNPRRFIAKLIADGQEVLVTSDPDTWQCASSPITYDSVYNGEVYDARNEGLTDLHFTPAKVADAPGGLFSSPKMPPVRRIEELTPVAITEPLPGVFVVDFGQNIAGRIKLAIKPEQQGPAGANITLRHAEVLQHTGITPTPTPGAIYTDNLRSARATDMYIFGDVKNDTITWEPTFTYHGFRYVEVVGIRPTADTIRAVVLHNDVYMGGAIKTDDPMLNAIQSAIWWGQRANVMSVPTDCPQRDERKGWLGDAQLSAEEGMFNFDMTSVYLKFLRDIVDTQDEDGFIGDTAPLTFGGRPSDPSWGSAFPSIVFYLYRETGDPTIVSEFYPSLLKYMSGVITQAGTFGFSNMYHHYGDWCWVPGSPSTSPHLTASFSLLENLGQMRVLANTSERQSDVSFYGSFENAYRKAFHATFYRPDNKTYDAGVQSSLALALWVEAPPESLRQSIADSLLADIIHTQRYHTTAGIIGHKYQHEVLAKMRREDVSVKMFQQRDWPSFGYMLSNPWENATTIWELWDAFQQGPGMNSRNHVMFGGPVGAWFYKFLAGIRADASSGKAGYREVLITPSINPCLGLSQINATLLTIMGQVASNWTGRPGRTEVDLLVPIGSTARVIFDGGVLSNTLNVTVNGAQASSRLRGTQGFEVLGDVWDSDSYVEVLAASGRWNFVVSYSYDMSKCEGTAHVAI